MSKACVLKGARASFAPLGGKHDSCIPSLYLMSSDP